MNRRMTIFLAAALLAGTVHGAEPKGTVSPGLVSPMVRSVPLELAVPAEKGVKQEKVQKETPAAGKGKKQADAVKGMPVPKVPVLQPKPGKPSTGVPSPARVKPDVTRVPLPSAPRVPLPQPEPRQKTPVSGSAAPLPKLPRVTLPAPADTRKVPGGKAPAPGVPDLRRLPGAGQAAGNRQETGDGSGSTAKIPQGLPLPGQGFVPPELQAGKPGRKKITPTLPAGIPPARTRPAQAEQAQRSVVIRDVRFENRHLAADGWPEWDLVVELENTDPDKPAQVALGYNQYYGANIPGPDIGYLWKKLVEGVPVSRTMFLAPGERKTVRITDGGYTHTTCGRVWLEGAGAANPGSESAPERQACLGDPEGWRVIAEIKELWSIYDGDDEGPTRWNVCWEISGHRDCFQVYARDGEAVRAGASGRRISFSMPDLRGQTLDVRIRIVDRDPGLFGEDDVGEGYAVVAYGLAPVLQPALADAYYLRREPDKRVGFRKVGAKEEERAGPKGYMDIVFHYVPE